MPISSARLRLYFLLRCFPMDRLALLKSMWSVSNSWQNSVKAPASATTTSHTRAPSRCILILFVRAGLWMLRISSRDAIESLQLFSVEITLVGLHWIQPSLQCLLESYIYIYIYIYCGSFHRR
ncbi:hypothetical protein GQ53DRAFT_865933 [Thozetella sp. PMI_491]|nr:hypothetical protein GQ53DRAFT_865933 [Thozetella sp. PMI_491]